MIEEKYTFDGKKLTVKKGYFKIVAEGEWARLYIHDKGKYVQLIGLDSGALSNIISLFTTLSEAIIEIKNKK
jgi:hypothetical protein